MPAKGAKARENGEAKRRQITAVPELLRALQLSGCIALRPLKLHECHALAG